MQRLPRHLARKIKTVLANYRQSLREFKILPLPQKVILSLPLVLVLAVTLAFILPRQSLSRKIKSPVTEMGRAEVAVSRFGPGNESPFSKLLSGKILGFKTYLAKTKNLQYEVFGYLPYWNFDQLPFLRLDLLSTVAYFALEIDPATGDFLKDGAYWHNWNGLEMQALIKTAAEAKTKILVTLKLFDNGPIEQFLLCRRCQEKTITQTLKEIKEKQVQGVNVDFEYLGTPSNETVIRFSQFMSNLADSVHKEIPNSVVSMAAYATSAREERIHNIELIGNIIDYVFIMGYDFFRPSSTHAGPVSPLGGVEKYGYDLKTSVEDFLNKIPAEKIVLGIPYYGYDWPVEGREPNSKVLEYNDRNGVIGLAYYGNAAIDPNNNSESYAWDFEASVPYYSYYDQEKRVWRQVYFDDLKSLGLKYDFIKSKKIRGVGIWALGFDNDRPELWDLLEQKFTKL